MNQTVQRSLPLLLLPLLALALLWRHADTGEPSQDHSSGGRSADSLDSVRGVSDSAIQTSTPDRHRASTNEADTASTHPAMQGRDEAPETEAARPPDDAGRAEERRAGGPSDRSSRAQHAAPGGNDEDEAAAQDAFVAEIRDSFREARHELRECYELILELDDQRADRLTFELLVVASAEDPSLGDAELQGIEAGTLTLEELECFAEVVGSMSFPPPSDGDSYTMRYPVALTTE